MHETEFSIIIPVYNAKKFVARAIQSAINQNYKGIEIICIDDKSTDESVRIIKEFMAKDKRIKLICNDRNLGTFATRNKGALSANGEYLLFLDADDYLHKDTCLKCHKILKTSKPNAIRYWGGGDNEFDFIMFNLFRQDEKDGNFKLCKVIDKTQIVDNYAFEAMYFGRDEPFYSIWNKCIKKATYLKALDFANVTRRITIAEDILISMALLGVSTRIALLDCGLYYYCYNEYSATRIDEPSKIQERIENLNFAISKFEEFAGKKDEFYKVFMQGMCKIIDTHIVGNQTQRFVEAYKRRVEKGYPKWLARFILSLQRRRFKAQEKKKILCDFIKENEKVFKEI